METLLAALVLGYEVAGRVGTAINPAHLCKGFHSTARLACSARPLLRLTCVACADQFARALGIAGSAAGGLFEFVSDGSTSKQFHGGHAAMAGVLTTDLAAGGLTGPLTIFEGEEGLATRSRRGRHGGDHRRPGGRFDLEHVYFKLHAACAHTFSPIDAVLECAPRRERGEIEQVSVHTYHAGAILNAPRPQTTPGAKFSIPYCLAAAWHHGRVSEEVFAARYLVDPALQAVAPASRSPRTPPSKRFPRLRAAQLAVLLRDGRRLERYVDGPAACPTAR